MGMIFEITDEELKRIEAWDDPVTGHKCTARVLKSGDKFYKYKGAIDDRLTYEFAPTSICELGTVKCCSCKEEFDFKSPLSFMVDWINEMDDMEDGIDK